MKVAYYLPLRNLLVADNKWRTDNNIKIIRIMDIDPSGFSTKQGYRIYVSCTEEDYLVLKLKYQILSVKPA